jgi:hypothetical protein
MVSKRLKKHAPERARQKVGESSEGEKISSPEGGRRAGGPGASAVTPLDRC